MIIPTPDSVPTTVNSGDTVEVTGGTTEHLGLTALTTETDRLAGSTGFLEKLHAMGTPEPAKAEERVVPYVPMDSVVTPNINTYDARRLEAIAEVARQPKPGN